MSDGEFAEARRREEAISLSHIRDTCSQRVNIQLVKPRELSWTESRQDVVWFAQDQYQFDVDNDLRIGRQCRAIDDVPVAVVPPIALRGIWIRTENLRD